MNFLSYLIASKKLEIKFVTLVNEENWKIVEDNAEVEGELTHIKRGYFKISSVAHTYPLLAQQMNR